MKIDLMTHPRFSVRRSATGLLLQTIPISLGIWTGSAAMQWVGFVFSLVLVIGLAVSLQKRDQGLTIQQARQRLDEIEAEEIK
jgi:hypothetical protein